MRLPDGSEMTVHCANSGSMLGLDRPGSAVLISDSQNPKRKLRHTLERVKVRGAWVGVNTMLPNHVVRDAIERGRVPELAGYDQLRTEVVLTKGTRIDLHLAHAGRQPCWVEVKNATLCADRVARFPDSVTERGQKHLRQLTEVVRSGAGRGVMFFLVNRRDCDVMEPADDIDAEYGRSLREAVAAGVEALAYRVRFRGAHVSVAERLPVRLP